MSKIAYVAGLVIVAIVAFYVGISYDHYLIDFATPESAYVASSAWKSRDRVVCGMVDGFESLEWSEAGSVCHANRVKRVDSKP